MASLPHARQSCGWQARNYEERADSRVSEAAYQSSIDRTKDRSFSRLHSSEAVGEDCGSRNKLLASLAPFLPRRTVLSMVHNLQSPA
jgi:hypothetical protein